MTSVPLRSDLNRLVAERIELLKHMPATQLRLLGEHMRETVVIRGQIGSLSVYCDRIGKGARRIVVQALRDRWFGLSTAIVVKGFVLNEADERVDLTEGDLFEFL